MTAHRKREDTADGCQALAQDDLVRAAATPNVQMRLRLERSADAWSARARLLAHLEAKFDARFEAKRSGSMSAS